MSVRRSILLPLGLMLVALALFSAPALGLETHVLSSSFGSGGTGAGELVPTANSGIAFNQVTHDLYVADTGNARVDEFSSSGTFIRAWGWGVADGLPTFETCTLICQAGLSGSGAGQFTTPTFIAVDNSAGASAGDVYVGDTATNVVSKFSASGAFISSNDGSGASAPVAGPFAALAGVAVDSGGSLWVYDTTGDMFEFAQDGSFTTDWNSGRGVSTGGIVIDSSQNAYVGTAAIGVAEFSPTGAQIGDIDDSYSQVTGIALDASTGDLYADDGSAIRHYTPSCNPAEGECKPADTFGATQLSKGGAGIASETASHDLYAVDAGNARIDIFTPALLPDVETGETSNFGKNSVTLNGTVDPDGSPVTSCRFEYGTSTAYDSRTECSVSPGSGTESVAVHADVAGLALGTYHYRLVAGNSKGDNFGGDRAFQAGASIEGSSVTKLGSTEATVSAQISAESLPTAYYVEYGQDVTYGARTSETSIGAPQGPVGVVVRLGGLQPGATYHLRFVAANVFDTTEGTDVTFTTEAAVGPSGQTLPDERVYELVSSLENPGDVYVPRGPRVPTEDIYTEAPYRASMDGEKVAYAGDPAVVGGTGNTGPGEGDEYLAERGQDGWTSKDVAAPGLNPGLGEGYQAFSDDLSSAIVEAQNKPPNHPPLTSDAPGKCGYVLYSRDNKAALGQDPYSALFTKADISGSCGAPFFVGASEDRSHLLFQDEVALAPGAEAARAPSGEARCKEHCDLYDSSGGQLHLVNVLPHGEADPNATFGSPSGNEDPPGLSGVISADGSRILWTDLNTNILYLRKDDTSSEANTIQISAGAARFWTAPKDGRYVFYTEGERLLRFDVDRFDASKEPESEALADAREVLAGDGADVQGVVGINETGSDGAYVYFVAGGALGPQAEKRSCKTVEEERREKQQEKAEKEEQFSSPEEDERYERELQQEKLGQLPAGRGCNLYLLHSGEPIRLIATLAEQDNNLPAGNNSRLAGVIGDWQANLGARSAEVTPDGRHLVFESSESQSLVGYNNNYLLGNETKQEPEVFWFDADTGQVSCASCAPSGAPPVNLPNTERNGTMLPVGANNTFIPRWLSEDGSHVFFETDQPLVAQDTNGLQDVYEWDREGGVGCPGQVPARTDGGCLSVLSGGTGSDWSWLVDAGASGRDVFFASRTQLVPADHSEKMQLYDARAGGGFPEIEHACTGSGCQGVPPAAPTFATPSSVTFIGVGNFEPPSKPTVKPKRKTAKCKAGFVKRRGKCVRNAKKKVKKSAKKAKLGKRSSGRRK